MAWSRARVPREGRLVLSIWRIVVVQLSLLVCLFCAVRVVWRPIREFFFVPNLVVQVPGACPAWRCSQGLIVFWEGGRRVLGESERRHLAAAVLPGRREGGIWVIRHDTRLMGLIKIKP